MPKEAIKAFSGAYETWELGSSTAAGLRPARRSNPGWLSRAAVGQVLTAVLGSLGFAVGEGADQYVDACFECCCSEQHQAAIWVDDVAQYAARVSASVNSCTPEQAASAIQRAWRSKAASRDQASVERTAAELTDSERTSLARSGLLWHACQALEHSFAEVDGSGGSPGMLNKSALQSMMGAMLAALGFEQGPDTTYLGERYVNSCWEQLAEAEALHVAQLIEFVTDVWQSTLGLQMAGALLDPVQVNQLNELGMSPAMILGEFWKHVRPGSAMVRRDTVLGVLSAYLEAYHLSQSIDIEPLAARLDLDVDVQQFTSCFLEVIQLVQASNYVSAMSAS